MRQFLSFLSIFILIIGFLLPVQAQNSSATKKRPTVGLVLSGGGARGFAHIGVLKILEENHIPIDYIGGASMGALIGALYSMGKSPSEIEQLVASLNWDKLLQPQISVENSSFRRREDRRNIPASVPLKGKITDLKLPNALNTGQEISFLFDRETLPYVSVRDFDNLPIPFRCVGTDMLNGNSITLKSGSLSQSLRATMSIPGIFSPVEIDGKILADGGLVNNIPTDVVKAMGADIILVVNIETQPGSREVLESLPGVLAQTINISTLDNSRRSLRQADIIIAPNLDQYSSSDFSKSKEIIQLGYSGAEQKVSLIKGLSLNDSDWQTHLAERRKRQKIDSPITPDYIAVEGKDETGKATIVEKLEEKYTNQPFDKKKSDELADDLRVLSGTGRFESLDYDVTKEDGKTGLLIRTNQIGETPKIPTKLEIGVDVNSVQTDSANFNFLARLTIFDVGRYGSEWRNDLQIGSNTYLASEYYRPLGKTKFFVAPRISFESRRSSFFNGDNRVAEYLGQRTQAGVDFGYTFNSRTEMRAGYAVGYESVNRRIGDVSFPNSNGSFSTFGVKLTYDSLNKTQIPTEGLYSRNSINYYFKSPLQSEKITQAETRNNIFKSLDESNILFGFGGGGTTFGNTASIFRQFTLGGPLRLGGYGYEQFRSSNYILGGIGILHTPKVFPTFFGGKTYIGAWYEGGSAFEKFSTANYRQSFSGGAIAETPIGQIFLGASVNENGRGRVYFSFGKIFR
jgi:NTE family protein